MDFKNSKASKTTITRDKEVIGEETQNIYKSIAVMAKRAVQINDSLREELHAKLQEFATNNDSLEEIFENKEQIEVSRFYERLPKPTAIAIHEWLDKKIYHRDVNQEEGEEDNK